MKKQQAASRKSNKQFGCINLESIYSINVDKKKVNERMCDFY